MDIFDKAQDLLDRAQEKVADATTLAAWKANQGVRARAAQVQKTEIEQQIETVTMKLGNGVYQMWKNRGGRDDKKIEELCHELDALLSRYRDVNAELAEINRATYDGMAIGARSAGPVGTATVLPPGATPAPATQVETPALQRTEPANPPSPVAQPRQATPQPPVPAPVVQPRQAAPQSPVTPPRSPQGSHDTAPPKGGSERAAPLAPAAPAAPARAAAKPKPCPSCGTTVPADVRYCPHCGYMAR
jgi:hypothetical protein